MNATHLAIEDRWSTNETRSVRPARARIIPLFEHVKDAGSRQASTRRVEIEESQYDEYGDLEGTGKVSYMPLEIEYGHADRRE